MAEQGLHNKLPEKLLAWYDRHARVLPWRTAIGEVPDPYRVWLSEIMLQQTTVAAVRDYFLKFVRLWPRVEDLAAAPLDEVLRAWAGLGYYARARNLHACAQLVATKYNNKFPADYTTLLSLPGVGPYTAGAIAAIAFDHPVAAVDGNVERVISRLYSIEEPLPLSKPTIKAFAQALVPARRAGDFAQAMMDLGATICAPRKANCALCPWAKDCQGRLRSTPEELPYKLQKKKVPTRYGIVYWVENAQGEVLVRTRKPSGLLGGMTEFPSSDWTKVQLNSESIFEADWREVAGEVHHTFTHFHLVLSIRKVNVRTSPLPEARFVAKSELSAEALPSLMRKVMRHMGL
jgi:A/G-specific adenine glycosylase